MGLLGFWIIAGAMALASGLVIALGWRRAGQVSTDATAIYRDQLLEVEHDLARGTLGADEADRLRVEVSRRLLDADRAARAAGGRETGREAGTDHHPPRSLWALLLVALVLATSFGGYLWLGVPGYPDLPLAKRIAISERLRAQRPTQAAAEAEAPLHAGLDGQTPDPEFLDLMEKLRKAVAEHPEDARGMELLARNEAALGHFTAAKQAQERLIALKADQAQAEDHAALAELMVMAAAGYVSPEAEKVLIRALSLDPRNGVARYYSGLMFIQIGRPDQAFRLWQPLLDESPAEAPWVAPIRAQLPQLARAAGVKYQLPPPRSLPPGSPPPGSPPGPTEDEIAASAGLSPEAREQMIRSMVEGLMARLGTQGGSADEWQRLISSLIILGDHDRARAIWREAQERFAGHPADLERLAQAAKGLDAAPSTGDGRPTIGNGGGQ
jgi:cytochrome c-type biogenesis protein CcmH